MLTWLLITNSVLLVVAVFVAIGMAQAGTQYTLHIGDTHRQKPLVDRILRGIVILIFIGLTAAFLNLLLG